MCGYGKGVLTRNALDFHHVKKKSFGLTKRHMGQFSWSAILKEVQKCVLLCCRCHREFHSGLITELSMTELYQKKWEELASNSAGECDHDTVEVGSSILPSPTNLDASFYFVKRSFLKIQKKCLQCGNLFQVLKSKSKRGYCSPICA